MNKIKKFIKDNNEELLVVAYGTIMLGVGFCFGKIYEGKKLNDALDYLARSGKTISNIVDRKEYVCSVTEVVK